MMKKQREIDKAVEITNINGIVIKKHEVGIVMVQGTDVIVFLNREIPLLIQVLKGVNTDK